MAASQPIDPIIGLDNEAAGNANEITLDKHITIYHSEINENIHINGVIIIIGDFDSSYVN